MKLERKNLVELGVAALLLYLAIHYWDAAMGTLGLICHAAWPLIFGAIVAFVVNILMSFYERNLTRLLGRFRKLRVKEGQRWLRALCMVLAFVTVALVLAFIVRMILPELQNCLNVLLGAIPKAVNALASWAEETFDISGLFNSFLTEWQGNQDQIKQTITSALNAMLYGAGSVMNVVVSATYTIVSGLITLFMGLIFAVHLLLGKERLSSQVNRLMDRFVPALWLERLRYFLSVLSDCFHSYIVCQVTEACILGGLCAAGMLLFRLPYALMIGCLIGVTALIPIAGAYIGGGIGAIMIFSVDPMQAVFFIIYLIVLQQIEGNLIYPRVAGSSLGLPGIWVLAAVTLGGGLLGIPGMLIGVPLTTAVYRMLREYVRKPAKTAG